MCDLKLSIFWEEYKRQSLSAATLSRCFSRQSITLTNMSKPQDIVRCGTSVHCDSLCCLSLCPGRWRPLPARSRGSTTQPTSLSQQRGTVLLFTGSILELSTPQPCFALSFIPHVGPLVSCLVGGIRRICIAIWFVPPALIESGNRDINRMLTPPLLWNRALTTIRTPQTMRASVDALGCLRLVWSSSLFLISQSTSRTRLNFAVQDVHSQTHVHHNTSNHRKRIRVQPRANSLHAKTAFRRNFKSTMLPRLPHVKHVVSFFIVWTVACCMNDFCFFGTTWPTQLGINWNELCCTCHSVLLFDAVPSDQCRVGTHHSFLQKCSNHETTFSGAKRWVSLSPESLH